MRRVRVCESSGGILWAVAAHVRSMFAGCAVVGGGAGGWVMVPFRSAGFGSLCVLAEGTECCGRWWCVVGGVADLHSGILWPRLSEGFLSPWYRRLHPCSLFRPPWVPRSPPVRMEDILPPLRALFAGQEASCRGYFL